ncbi:MAG: hypothetical protein LQ344_001874 [Seirophora lacunosa]|nr:MAG: hypothetical protein LQ344_001874 [Seirophora lacunosa]
MASKLTIATTIASYPGDAPSPPKLLRAARGHEQDWLTDEHSYLGPWGNFGSQTQKGIITYAISSNRQKPFAGATRTAVFNTFRRSKAQFLYVVPPFAGAYLLMNWAIEKNEFYNSKEGRMKAPEESDDATQGGPVRG